MARPKVVHIKSNTLNKKPTTDQIDYGEIAVNYNSGNTFLAVKDSKNDIKVFTDKTTNDASYAPKSDFNELKQDVINNEQTTSAALNDLNTRVNQLSSVDMGNYAATATTEAIKSDISGLKTSVGVNETKISALEANLSSYVPTSRTINGKTLSQDITKNSVASATTSKSATTASSASSVAWSNVKNAPSFASSDHTHSEYVKKTGDTMRGTLSINNSNSTALTCTGKTEFEGDVTVTGKVSASSGFFQTSDRRLKNFQGDIEVDFDKLKSIPKKYFYWNMDSKKSKLEIGTSAQEVMEVYPELVSINEAGMLSVAYDKLSVIALKAVDELHEENVALKEKNDELERRLKAIEEKLGI